jgi:hypothetical protein
LSLAVNPLDRQTLWRSFGLRNPGYFLILPTQWFILQCWVLQCWTQRATTAHLRLASKLSKELPLAKRENMLRTCAALGWDTYA